MDSQENPSNHFMTYSLKKRLRGDLLVIFGIGLGLVLAVDTYAIAHIRAHILDGQGQSNPSLLREMLDTIPFLLIPHAAILYIVYFVAMKTIDREITIPLLSLAGKVLGWTAGKTAILSTSEPIPEEIAPLFEALQDHLASSRDSVNEKK